MATGTRAPRTIVTINLTGQTDFNIPFEYLARKFVVVTLLGVDRKVLVLNTDYRFVGKTVISLINPTPAGYTQLELRRETSATERLVDYHDGSILRAYDLNLSQIQTLHVAEEARDLTADTIGVNDEGHLDARNRKIVNLAYAENGGDAIPLGQVMQWNESALNSANIAISQAEHASVQAQDSANSATESKKAAEQSIDRAEYANVRAQDSANSADKSQGSASASATSAEQARSAADDAIAAAAPATALIRRIESVEESTALMESKVESVEESTALMESKVERLTPHIAAYMYAQADASTGGQTLIKFNASVLVKGVGTQDSVTIINKAGVYKASVTATKKDFQMLLIARRIRVSDGAILEVHSVGYNYNQGLATVSGSVYFNCNAGDGIHFMFQAVNGTSGTILPDTGSASVELL